MSSWKHWCSKCGRKQVVYRGTGWRTVGKKVYECMECDGKFTKKQVERY